MVQSYKFVLLKTFFASIPEKNKLMNEVTWTTKRNCFSNYLQRQYERQRTGTVMHRHSKIHGTSNTDEKPRKQN